VKLDELPDVLTVREVAAVLRTGKNEAYALIRDGRIYAAHIGRSLRVPKTAVVAFLNGQLPDEPQLRVIPPRSGTG
jgi:excisionase family DNA binding protein